MPTNVATLLERAASLRSPLSTDAPSGTDLSFDPSFEFIKAEIDKLAAMSGGTPDWSAVAQGSEDLLRTRTKDLRLATWLTMAAGTTRGWEGLVEGVAVMRGLVEDHWPTMFPDARRARGRANLMGWFHDQMVVLIPTLPVSAEQADAMRELNTQCKELDLSLVDKLGDVYPGLARLKSLLRDLVKQLPAPAAAVPPPPPAAPAPPLAAQSVAAPAHAPATPAPEPLPAPAPPPPVAVAPVATPTVMAPVVAAPVAMPAVEIPPAANAAEAVATVRSVGKALMDTAKLVRRADPAQPWSYRLQRQGAWMAVQAPPPAEAGKTRIQAPTAEVKKKLAALHEGGKWLELLLAAEDATQVYIFWVDLHRLVALAMDRLGAQFLSPREVVGDEVVAFFKRYPTIPSLRFADGTPFADAATTSWLDGEQKARAGGGDAATGKAVDEEDAELKQRLDKATEWVQGGKVGEGLGLALQLANRAPDQRARFRARLGVGQLAFEAGRPDIARPLLEQLVAEADRHALEEWEPGLCASLYGTLLRTWKAGSSGPNAKKVSGADQEMREAVLFDKLCRLDPASALQLAVTP